MDRIRWGRKGCDRLSSRGHARPRRKSQGSHQLPRSDRAQQVFRAHISTANPAALPDVDNPRDTAKNPVSLTVTAKKTNLSQWCACWRLPRADGGGQRRPRQMDRSFSINTERGQGLGDTSPGADSPTVQPLPEPSKDSRGRQGRPEWAREAGDPGPAHAALGRNHAGQLPVQSSGGGGQMQGPMDQDPEPRKRRPQRQTCKSHLTDQRQAFEHMVRHRWVRVHKTVQQAR